MTEPSSWAAPGSSPSGPPTPGPPQRYDDAPGHPNHGGPQNYGGPRNPDLQNYGGQNYGGQNYGGQAYGGQAYGGQGWYGGPPGWAPPPMAPKPGVIPLRPLGLGEILDGAVSYIRANPKATLGLSAVVITLTQLVQLPTQAIYLDSLSSLTAASRRTATFDDLASALGGGLTAGLIGGLLSFVAVTMLTGMLIVVLSQAVLGRRATLGATWTQVRPRLLGLLGLTLLSGLITLVPVVLAVAVVLVLVLIGAPGGVVGVVAVIGVLVTICALVFVGVCLSMATPAYVLEGIGATAALRRSYHLVRPQFWRVFGILLVGGLIAAVIAGIIVVPFSLISGAITGVAAVQSGATTIGTLPALLIGAVGSIIASTLTAPFSAGVSGLLYIDQRIRREALDIELARAAHGPQ